MKPGLGRGLDSLLKVYDEETIEVKKEKTEKIPSISYIPGIAGLMMAGEVIRDIIK